MPPAWTNPNTMWLRLKYFRSVVCLAVVVMVIFIIGTIRYNSPAPHVDRATMEWHQGSFDPNESLSVKLKTEENLMLVKSRGASIFVDPSGTVRIPPQYVVDVLELRDLEELYHRYVESIQVRCNKQVHFGNIMDGGYDVCEDPEVKPKQPCVAYSFGVRDDFSFDEKMVEHFGCEVHSFDPANGMEDHLHSPGVHFHSLGLGATDGPMNDWTMKTANTIKDELHHSHEQVQLMKIDIEAGEWAALPQMLSTGALRGVKQLIMEFHTFVDLPPWIVDGRNLKDYRQHLHVLRGLYDEGFRIFYFKRFPAQCCMYKDFQNAVVTGCLETHFIRVNNGSR